MTAETLAQAGDDEAAAIANLFKSSGTQVTLTLAGDAVAKMEVFSTAGALIDHLSGSDGAITAYTDAVTSGFGPDAVTTDVTFSAENVVDVTDGCIAVYWKAPDGWHLLAGESIKGRLTDGADHQYYVLEDANGSTVPFCGAAQESGKHDSETMRICQKLSCSR